MVIEFAEQFSRTSSPLFDLLSFSSQEMEKVEKLKTANANLEQRKEELVKELEQVTKLRA